VTAPPPPPDRLNTLADGVFAIAMTVLVLQLGVPVATGDDRLGDLLLGLWPDLLMYALSFLVLGVFWLVHHMIFRVIVGSDSTLVWLNIVFLMFAALIPFATALIGEHGAETGTALFYGGNMLALFFIGWAMWIYGTSDRANLSSELDRGVVRGARTMGLIYFAVFAVPLGLAFVSPVVSMVIYGLIVVVFIGFTLIGRDEAITIWGAARHD
jgi:uncharacterized membrane protein